MRARGRSTPTCMSTSRISILPCMRHWRWHQRRTSFGIPRRRVVTSPGRGRRGLRVGVAPCPGPPERTARGEGTDNGAQRTCACRPTRGARREAAGPGGAGGGGVPPLPGCWPFRRQTGRWVADWQARTVPCGMPVSPAAPARLGGLPHAACTVPACPGDVSTVPRQANSNRAP